MYTHFPIENHNFPIKNHHFHKKHTINIPIK